MSGSMGAERPPSGERYPGPCQTRRSLRPLTAGRNTKTPMKTYGLYVIICESGTEWLVRASSAEEAAGNWPNDAEPLRLVEPLGDDEGKAQYLIDMGQSDV